MSISDPKTINSLAIRAKFYENLFISSTDQQKIIADLTNLNSGYGFDIAAITILFHRYQISGKVEFLDHQAQKSSITFHEGQIQFIELPDTDTRIGALLVSHKMITEQQLEKALKDQPKGLPIGSYLVQIGWISKEQIGFVILSQSRSRLSKLINDQKFSITFTKNSTNLRASELNIEQFNLLIHDWIISKFSNDWLNAHYLEYFNYKITVNWDSFTKDDLIKYSVLSLFEVNFLEVIDSQKINDLSLIYENNKNFFKAIHFLMLNKWISIQPSAEPDNYEIKIKHIYRLSQNKIGLELIEQLSLITKQDEDDIEAILEDLQNNYLGSERISNDFKLEIEKKTLNLLINFRNLKKDDRSPRKDKKLDANIQIDLKPIKALLLSNKYSEALTLVKKNKQYISAVPKLQLYSAWAHLGLALFKKTDISISTLEKEFLSISPEDMTSADYQYVNYLLLKSKKQDQPAQIALKKALDKDPAVKNYPVIKSIFGWF